MIKELSRRCEMGENGGMACGPISLTAVVSEMVVDDSGSKKFLTCCWVSEASDGVSFEVTDEALLPYYVDLDSDQDEMEKIRDTISEQHTSYDGEYSGKYPEQYKILIDMIKKKLVDEGLHDPDDYEDDEDEWDF